MFRIEKRARMDWIASTLANIDRSTAQILVMSGIFLIFIAWVHWIEKKQTAEDRKTGV
jgi:hypothetical protein